MESSGTTSSADQISDVFATLGLSTPYDRARYADPVQVGQPVRLEIVVTSTSQPFSR